MNRRIFSKKVAGALTAIGAVAGMKAEGDTVEYDSQNWSKGIKMPPGATRFYLGYKLELCRSSGRDGMTFMVCHYSLDERGGHHGDHSTTRHPDTAAWNRKIGTFY